MLLQPLKLSESWPRVWRAKLITHVCFDIMTMPEDSYLSKAYSTSSKTRAFEHHKHLTRQWGWGMELVVRCESCSSLSFDETGHAWQQGGCARRQLPVTSSLPHIAKITQRWFNRPGHCSAKHADKAITRATIWLHELWQRPFGFHVGSGWPRRSRVIAPCQNALCSTPWMDTFLYQEWVRSSWMKKKGRMEETNLDLPMSNPKGLLGYYIEEEWRGLDP